MRLLLIVPDGLYIGDMKISGNDFEQTHQLEMSVRGFNATGCRLAFPSTNGDIEYEAKVGEEVVASGQLLTPSILRDTRNTWENENNTEFNLVFTQPLDPNAVKNISNCLEKNGTVSFKLENLDIRLAPTDDHSNSTRLPVWDGITLRKPATRYVSGRLISVRMGLGAFSMKSSNPDAKS